MPRRTMIEGIGRGIGRAAIHEFAHLLLGGAPIHGTRDGASYEMKFARDISDEVMMLDGGKIIEAGPPEQIFTEPAHERTRKFLSSVL